MSFPKYPEYKDSGVEWLTQVPSHWQVSLSKRFITVQSGDMISADRETDEGFPIIGGNGFRAFTTEFNTEANTLVIGRVGAQCGCIHHINERFWASEHAFRVIEKLCVDKRFFFHTLAALNLNQFAIKTAQPLLNTTIVETQWISVPPLPEQSAIAAFLDRETAKIDALVAEQEKLIELLKEKRQAVISHAVTKGLDPNVPMKDSGLEWLGDMPEHWNIIKVSHLFSAKKGSNAAQLTKEYCADIDGEHPVYSGQTDNNGVMACINEYEFDTGIEGVILSTTVGAKAMSVSHINGKFSLSQNCMIIISKSKNASIRFFYYHFHPLFKYERDMIPCHMQPSFRMEDLYGYFVALPPLAEQDKICAHLDSHTAKIDELVLESEKAIILLKERRSALISAAVTGKIDVRGLAEATQ